MCTHTFGGFNDARLLSLSLIVQEREHIVEGVQYWRIYTANSVLHHKLIKIPSLEHYSCYM
ncbi:hypothetical protein ACS0TY_007378 [Phlomoides rotata]